MMSGEPVLGASPQAALKAWVAPVVLEGGRVRLEPLSEAHLQDLCAVGLEESLWAWTVSRVRTAGEMRSYVEVALEERRLGRALPFATLDLASGRAVGSTRFASLEPAHHRLEIGWTWLGRPWQRTALNTEAKYLMLRHAFEVLGCRRVEFKTDALNQASRRALLRIGAREEGTLRAHSVTVAGRVRDTVYYSVLDTEWPAVQSALERRLKQGLSPARGPTAARRLSGGFELDDDPGRIDVAAVSRFLATTYWAQGRPREEIERLIREASRVVGLYAGDNQIGFARTVSDGAAFAYLADVYVLPEHRGNGLGLELVREAVERGPFAGFRWLLHTADAHGLYAKLGFGAPSERVLERQGREP